MAKALTDKRLEAIEKETAPLVRQEIPDGLVLGLYLVRQPSKVMSWAVRYRHAGHPRKLTLGSYGAINLKVARKLAREALADAAGGGDPARAKQEKKLAGDPLTVEGLITSYLDRHVYKRHHGKAAKRARKKAPLRSGAEIERILRKELAPFRKRPADGISGHEAKRLIDNVAERGHVIANRTLTQCRALYNFALAERAVTTSPFAGLELVEEDARERVLSTKELPAVWAAADKLGHPYTAIVHLLILTGQRLNEIAGLRWSEIDFAKRQIELPGARTKNGRPHIVALSDAAIEILKAAPKVESGESLVFSVTGSRLNGWSKMRKRLAAAVIEALDGEAPEHWTLHDIRRSAATRMAEDLRVPPHVVDKVLNHSSGVVKGVMAVYNRAQLLDERRSALEAWGRYVDDLVNGGSNNKIIAMRG